ncbi:MAG: SDR family oxidoreductase [Actinobacteria bacterium]|nr:SDR family oxidoreductase [Actinomycetota bacterium]
MRVAMVTGSTSGIGRAVARRLALMGFSVVAAGRSEDRLRALVAEIGAAGGTVEPLLVDLASLDSVRRAAVEFVSTGRRLDVLVNNAGVAVARGVTREGFQIQFGVNHLGHFLLTNELRSVLGEGSRVVVVSSDMHHRADGIDFERLRRPTRSMFGVSEYATSKLANVLFARELARRQPAWRVHAVHPGLVDTALFPALVRPLVRRAGLTPEQGADTIVWCATEDSLGGLSGRYYARRTEQEPSAVARDDSLGAELWVRSEEWCGVEPQSRDG